jgi:hypothetical protein
MSEGQGVAMAGVNILEIESKPDGKNYAFLGHSGKIYLLRKI